VGLEAAAGLYEQCAVEEGILPSGVGGSQTAGLRCSMADIGSPLFTICSHKAQSFPDEFKSLRVICHRIVPHAQRLPGMNQRGPAPGSPRVGHTAHLLLYWAPRRCCYLVPTTKVKGIDPDRLLVGHTPDIYIHSCPQPTLELPEFVIIQWASRSLDINLGKTWRSRKKGVFSCRRTRRTSLLGDGLVRGVQLQARTWTVLR